MTHGCERESKELRSLLSRWQSGELNERQIHEEAERIWAQGSPWPELPEEDPRSVVAETGSKLESLNAEWVTVEDIPAMLSFLDSEDPVTAWSNWRSYWQNVNFAIRKHKLESNPYYAKTGPLT